MPSVERSPYVDQSITQPLCHCLIFGCLITLEIMYLLIVFLPLLGSSVAGFFGRFLGSEGTAIMITGRDLVLLGIFLLGLIFLFSRFRLPLTKKYGFPLVFVIHACLVFLISLLFSFFRGYTLSLFSSLVIFGMVSGGGPALPLPAPSGPTSSSTGSEDSLSTSTNIVVSGDSRLSHSPAQNPEPGENLLSHFGALDQNPARDGGEIELYARIRLLESRLIDRLPPQLNLGEYETLVREHLKTARNFHDYQSALANELFDIYVLESKANLQDQLFNLLLQEPDQNLTTIFRKSPFHEKDIRREALEFLEEKLEGISFRSPFAQYNEAFLKATLEHWLQHLQENGHDSILYTGFVAHFCGI